ncbi:FkbM family methyltransferase [Olleya sp. R77988]|uniref:FkbM family methyltransferase n=1 Tax=Olleya sp. R77988 TaxID=3093875 RepID=UPI0037C89C7D
MLIKKLLHKTYQIKNLPKWINLLGVSQYFKLITQLKSDKQYLELKVKGYDGLMYLRPNTSDFKIFKQIFIEEEYNVTIPFDVCNIIDAGSNCGYSIVYFKNRFKNAKIIAIEPDTSNIEIIKKNTNHFSNIELIKGGVWYKNTGLNILDKNAGKWAFRVVEAEDNHGEFKGYSLNNIMESYNLETIDILKIDIEGSEKLVFEKDYNNWLSKTKFGFLELHENYAKGVTNVVNDRLNAFDFKISQSGENVVFSKNN